MIGFSVYESIFLQRVFLDLKRWKCCHKWFKEKSITCCSENVNWLSSAHSLSIATFPLTQSQQSTKHSFDIKKWESLHSSLSSVPEKSTCIINYLEKRMRQSIILSSPACMLSPKGQESSPSPPFYASQMHMWCDEVLSFTHPWCRSIQLLLFLFSPNEN